MTNLQLNTLEEALLIILTILLLFVMISLLFFAYRRRSLLLKSNKVKEEDKLWNDFIIIDSTEHMTAIKKSESPSFESSHYHRPSTATLPIQQQQHSSSLANNSSNSAYSFSHLPQSPPPVYNL